MPPPDFAAPTEFLRSTTPEPILESKSTYLSGPTFFVEVDIDDTEQCESLFLRRDIP